jgi:hypothetical protein
MENLIEAIKAKVPFVSVKSDDPVFAVDVLTWIAGEIVKPMPPDAEAGPAGDTMVYYTNADIGNAKMWLAFKNLGKTLVFINAKKSVLHLDCGQLFPPKDMLIEWLSTWLYELKVTPIKNKVLATELAQAFGGLTLKEAFEVLKLSKKASPDVMTLAVVNRVRQSLVSKAKGITQVLTDSEFYQVPGYLSSWLNLNVSLFLNPPHASLMPRGLIFDGPPGTGKTAGAKHVAQTLGLPLYRLDIGGMKGKYVGDSEGALAAALTQIDQAAPCVVLMDEVEKVFQTEGDKGVTSSMLGALLWWLQEHSSQVLTIMTTNKLSAIPPELFREGRVDQKMVFNGLESKAEGMEFATVVFSSLAAKVALKSTDQDMADIMQGLDQLFVEGKAVPQVKITGMVYSLIKGRMAAKE